MAKKPSKGGKQPPSATGRSERPEDARGASDAPSAGKPPGSDLPPTVVLDRGAVTEAAEGPEPGAPGRLLAAAASIFGLWVSWHITARHLDLKYGEALEDALCKAGDTFNCDDVLNSDYATIGPLPISVPQLANFVVVLALVAISFLASHRRVRQAATSYVFGLGLLSVLVSAFMFYVSKTQIGAFCPYCMMLYGANAAIFVGGWWAGRTRSLGLSIQRAVASLAAVPLLLGAAALWGVTVGGSHLLYQRTKDRLVTEGIARQESQRKDLEAQGFKFPTVTADDPFRGPADARVTLVEFADFECSYCKRLSYELARIEEQYADSVKVVFKNYPMNTACNPHVKNNRHPYACAAAVAAECVRIQGKFWEYHDLLYKNQHQIQDDDLRHYAEQVGVDVAQWESCLKDPHTMALVRADMDDAARLKVDGTPRMYIEGEELKGAQPAELIAARLAKALGEAGTRVKRDTAELEAARAEVADAPAEVAVSAGAMSFHIDAFEATVDAEGKAVSQPGAAPAVKMSWYAAKDACEKAGRRLCTQKEWMAACMGAEPVDDDGDGGFDDDYLEGTEYPYGDTYEAGRCWTQGDVEKQGPQAAGRFALCRTPAGVYDLSGNVAEWVGATEDEAMLMGGSWSFEDKAKCQKGQDTYGPGWANRYTGVRCCR